MNRPLWSGINSLLLAKVKHRTIISRAYGKISKDFDKCDPFSLKQRTSALAFQQIHEHFVEKDQRPRVIDLGVGTGNFLYYLQKGILTEEMVGVDFSQDMLDKVADRLQIKTVISSIENIESHFQSESFGLVIGHSILSSVCSEIALKRARFLLDIGGCFSVITMTSESFLSTQKYFRSQLKSLNPIKRLGGHYYQYIENKTSVPKDFVDFEKIAEKSGLQVIKRNRLEQKVCFQDVPQIARFGWDAGWLLNAVSFLWFPIWAVKPLIQWISPFVIPFPINDNLVFEVILFQKN